MNVAYKHLDAKLRIGDLTLVQWLGVMAGVMIAVAWGAYLSPFGTTPTVVSAVYIGSLPIGAALLSGTTEFDLWLVIRSALAWHRLEGRYMRGPGDRARGYLLHEDTEELERRRRSDAAELDLETLWEGS